MDFTDNGEAVWQPPAKRTGENKGIVIVDQLKGESKKRWLELFGRSGKKRIVAQMKDKNVEVLKARNHIQYQGEALGEVSA
jgi:hypothetical protein